MRNLLPLFVTFHYVDDFFKPLVEPVTIFYVIDPPKSLVPVAPRKRLSVIGLQLDYAIELALDSGKVLILQDYHILPVVFATKPNNRAIGVKAVKKQHNR